ncbi:glycosyltransferase family 4 protein [Roseateles oligotrophus]|uniref:Glycosyltransferase family 4 protein n=1 Tax=Roseateles oligotrophus TaxID=1769250 RepID=A0ABT2YDY6_9BURK|nr:glycosyltransferase family 4 protein [Roseateles oligotrophus]MCV2368247.1 glycosyltransferase family 4 protein [Roseateles oligotrophus]
MTQWFDPEPTFKGLVFARELVRQGFDVEVVTGFPNYPGGKIYPGYRVSMLRREIVDGIQVTRVPLYPNHGPSALKRVVNYVSFSFSALLYGLFMAKRPDVIYAYHPPLTVGVVASLVRFFRGVPVVYDIQDMWPDTLRSTGMVSSARALNVVQLVCKWVYRRVDHIVVLSPGFKTLLEQRGVSSSKVDVIYNWADETALSAPKGNIPSNFPGNERFRIVFAGNMGRAQALDSVLDAAALLQARQSRVTFVMLGGGVDVERLEFKAKELSLRNIVFFPPVPMAEVGVFLEASDVLLVHLRKDPLFEVTIPSKTQAYMAVSKPLLMAVEGDAAELVTRADCGLVVESENAEALASAADRFASMPLDDLEEMGGRGKSYYSNNLALQVGVAKFGTIFARLAAGNSSC